MVDRGESLTVFWKGNFIFLIIFKILKPLSTSLCFFTGKKIELPPVKTISISHGVSYFVIPSDSLHFFLSLFLMKEFIWTAVCPESSN